MKRIETTLLPLIIFFLLHTTVNAQKGAIVTETFAVSGNCGMCKRTIESAATTKGVKKVSWNDSTQILTLKYDKSKTTASAILKRVASSGYDNQLHRAPNEAYDKLHGCCKYERASSKEHDHKGE